MSGITAQYGFEYQKLIFIKTILENFRVDAKFGFENKDDVDYEINNPICGIINGQTVIQSKSGNITDEILCKVIANWMLLDPNNNYILMTESTVATNISDESFFEKFVSLVNASKGKRSDSIFKKIYLKYSNNALLEKEDLKKDFRNVVAKIQIEVNSLNNLLTEIEHNYILNFCEAIKTIPSLCKKRVMEFMNILKIKIDSSMMGKQPLLVDFPQLIKIITDISNRYNQDHYVIDVNEFKNKKTEEIRQLIAENKKREVIQLGYVFENPKQISRQLINKLLYEDFRSVYTDDTEISNIEYQAKDCHSSIIDEYGETIEPKKLFELTTSKSLESNKLPRGKMYSDGCYIYLTSDEAKENYKIWWKKDGE